MIKQETNLKEYEEECERCEGCRGCSDSNGSCVLNPYYTNKHGNKIECPCQTCLVKGICIKTCGKLQDYYNQVVRVDIESTPL